MRYAEGVIDNHFRYYVRDDGMAWHRAEELGPSCMLRFNLLANYSPLRVYCDVYRFVLLAIQKCGTWIFNQNGMLQGCM